MTMQSRNVLPTTGKDKKTKTLACSQRLQFWTLNGCWLVAFNLVVSPVYADILPPTSISTDPTRVQQPLYLPEPVPVNKGDKLVLPPVPKASATQQVGKTIVVKQVEFAGHSVFSTQELNAIAQPYLNRPLTAGELEELSRNLTLLYVNKGYINSGAVINHQSVANGVLKISLIEGKLTDVKQTGQGRLRESYIRDRLMLGAGEPLNVNQLQNSYRLLLGDPLIERLNGRLVPGNQLGEATLDVNVTRARPYQLYAGTDNYQTPSVGGVTGRMGGWVDNLLSLGERIDGQFTVNGGTEGYNTGIELPINAYDTRINFRYGNTYTTIVEAPLNTLDIKNNIIGYEGGVSHPVYRTLADELLMGLSFAVRQNNTTLSGTCVPTTSGLDSCGTQATVLRLSQRLTHRGNSHNLAFWSTFNVGVDALGATINKPGFQSGEFFSWLGQSIFSQRVMDNGAMLVLKGNIQLADSPLLNLEQYSVGGVYTVRGYRENTYVRDNGFNVGIEFKYPLFINDYLANNGSLYLVPFMDYGGAWNNPTSEQSQNPTDYLHSVGIGFNWQYQKLTTDFYWAHAIASVNNPLKQATERDMQDDGFHFRVNLNAF